MESKKINQLATNVAPQSTDLTIIGDPITGVSKKITWLQVSTLIGTAANLQQVTDNGATTTNPIAIGGLTITGLATGVLKSNSGVIASVPFGAANGVATLGGDGKVPSSQLPSYVDDVVEVANYAALPAIGETGKIYITLDTNKVYRWTGSIYVEIAANNAVWGAITGTLSNQTDLQNALNAKLSSVGLSMPSAFTVTNSPLTANGTIAVTGAGVASQYVRGDGTLANFPTSGGGGGSVSYYFNSSVSQGTLGGVAYRELNKVPVIGAGTDITIATNGYIANYITDVGDPALLEIPAGNWNFEMYFSASSGGGTPSFYLELYKYDGTTFTLISSSSATPEGITGGTAIDLYTTALAVPTTALTLTDRLAVRVYVNNSGRTITLHTENSHLCQVITTFSTGITALNGLTAQVQYFGTGTSGTDFNISSATATHTFNLPVASATNTGKLSSTDWSTFNNKLSTSTAAATYVPYTGATNHLDLGENDLFTRSAIIKQLVKLEGFVSGSITNAAALAIKTSTQGFVYGGTGYVSITSNETNALTVVNESGLWSRISFNSISANRTFTFPNATGTIALTSDIPSLSGYIQGSGTTNYVPKFTASGTIGNSLIYDTGTRIAIGGTSATYGVLTVQSDAGQFCIQSNTTPGKQLQIGYDHVSNNSYLSSLNQGVAFTNLLLQPNGGNVGVGTTTSTMSIGIAPQTDKLFVYNASGTNTGVTIQQDGTGDIFRANGNSGANRFVVQQGGNVGIGVTPSAWVSGSRALQILKGAIWKDDGNYFSFTNNAYFDGTNWRYVSSDFASNYAQVNSTHQWFIASSGTAGNVVSFNEAMRITSGGQVLMHSTTYNSANAGQYFGGGGETFFTVNGGSVLYLNRLTSDGIIVEFQKNTVTTGSISTNTYSLPSDLNFKKNISNLELGLNLITKLRAVSYNHKIDDDDAALSTGFIAQELEQSLTELGVKQNDYYILQHKPNEDKKQSQYWLDYTKMIPVLVNAIKELKAEIDELKNK